MSRPRSNIFRFRLLKWGAPKRLEGMKAIGRDARAPVRARRRGGGTIGLVVAVVAAALAAGLAALGWF